MMGTDRDGPAWTLPKQLCAEFQRRNYYYQQPRYARDAPQVLEEGQARAGEGRKGRVQSRKGSEGREAREPGSEGRAPPTGDEETGREEARGRGADPAAPTGRCGSGDRGGPCRPGRSGPHCPSDEGRLREARGRVPGRRDGLRRGLSDGTAPGRDPRPGGLARLPGPRGLRAGRAPQGDQPAAQFLQVERAAEGPHLARQGTQLAEGEADPGGPGEDRPLQGRPGSREVRERTARPEETRVP